MQELINCDRCGGNACLHTLQNQDESWLCFGCGFSTTTNLIEGSNVLEETLLTLPDLYKDLAYFKDSKVWLPSSINLPDKGIVFADGTNKEDWVWSAASMVEIKQEEKFKFPEEQVYKVDYKNKKEFSQSDFMDALDYIGFFNIEIEK